MRFAADLLTPGIYVVEQTSSPEEELRARNGVVVAQTTTTGGERGWIILDPTGRTHTLTDAQVHFCGAEGCPQCPRPDRRALRTAIGRELTAASRGGPRWTWADHDRQQRIRTLLRALRST